MAKYIETRVKELIVEHLGLEPGVVVTLESFFVEDLGADSFGVTMLVTALETEYNLEIPADDVVKMKRVGDVVEYIKARVRV